MTLEQAISFAAQVHEGQVDKAGQTYILHPLRVMLRFKRVREQRVAVLHDVMEDSGVTREVLLRKGLPEVETEAVVALSKTPAEERNYDAFIKRVARNPLATRVKLADLEENMDLRRFPRIGPDETARLEKYRRAHRRLRGAGLAWAGGQVPQPLHRGGRSPGGRPDGSVGGDDALRGARRRNAR